jgi:hypothetical protein
MYKDISMIHFPFMHPELVPGYLPASIMLMDPGHVPHAKDSQPRYFRSTDLVYEDRLARKFLEDSLEFGAQFKHASDAAYYQAGKMNDFFSGSMQEIKSEILSSQKDDTEEVKKKRVDAQLLLLLGFHLEEQMLELGALENRITTSVRDFEENLGMSEDDQHGFGPDFCAHKQKTLASPTMDWHRLVAPFVRFVPENCALVITDPLIWASMQEQGLQSSPISPDELAALFPDWKPPFAMSFSLDTLAFKELGAYAGVKVPEDLLAKEVLLLGMTKDSDADNGPTT